MATKTGSSSNGLASFVLFIDFYEFLARSLRRRARLAGVPRPLSGALRLLYFRAYFTDGRADVRLTSIRPNKDARMRTPTESHAIIGSLRQNLTAIRLTVSCSACVIIPGRMLFLHCARIPNNKPYTVITTTAFTPW